MDTENPPQVLPNGYVYSEKVHTQTCAVVVCKSSVQFKPSWLSACCIFAPRRFKRCPRKMTARLHAPGQEMFVTFQSVSGLSSPNHEIL